MSIYRFIKVFLCNHNSDSFCIDTVLLKKLSKKNTDGQTDRVKLRVTLIKVKLANK